MEPGRILVAAAALLAVAAEATNKVRINVGEDARLILSS